ncbi:Sortilin-Vps10 domain-containing protein [Sulfidibacter corallicola]|uniref:Sortilin N-terminal domain-containing protein n=1 Tax=Sulfidibacter corallicola TaxID=2818388 RepID=A0A8A4TQW1_SULCO|nr:hypothetical protein [Sulfidibacter corallicola]QTD51341.1 hypothetical protein J3U87_02635 [Sulfidibacter corallicola]
MNRTGYLFMTALLLGCLPISAAKKKTPDKTEPTSKLDAKLLGGLALRNIGPALTSGRIGDLAVDPRNRARYYVAVASGGVWKTENAGTTWQPIFDSQGSYSIGCITLDPSNPHVVWVGTGENQNQRSVGYGDGVYRSRDGGKSWEHMGLKESEHIAKIIVDPRDSNRILVASQGPLWSAGGQRGLFLSENGGADWKAILEIDEHTGVTDLVMDPRDPDVLYAAAHQRRRRVWTQIHGGPGSGLHKSTDGGKTWRKIHNGLPSVELGRIGLAISPVDPDVVYAMVEAAQDKSGFFRSTDRGESWEKRSSYNSSPPLYYQEIFADPKNVDRVYAMDTWLHVTEDGGKSFHKVPERAKHVDNHAMWIDPNDTDYLLVGCDGGLYESFDRGQNWAMKTNLPITQFYRVAVDDAKPFYNIYGGTQDNNTLGGPSRTNSQHGITNRDWFVTVGGDGFEPAIEPGNPNIVYAQYQYGGLARFDKASGEITFIQPPVENDEDPARYNWDAALILSPHSPTRLYFASQRVYRSDDRGQSWTAISGDLSRGLDRNTLPVMGKIWSIDSIAKSRSTSPYGNVVFLSESSLTEGLIYAGTDDGLIQVTEDGGQNWRRLDRFPGIPERTYVNAVVASRHQADRVYAVFNNHKSGDFKPYVLKSDNRGRSWTTITADLPERGSTYCLVEDPIDPELLFVGTEFGLFTSMNGGGSWIRLQGGMPTIAIRDLDIQPRENDLVAASFGRGFFVLDDYSPLRTMDEALLEREAHLFPVKDAWAYHESYELGVRGKGFQGDSFYNADNPPFGAVLTLYLKEAYPSLTDQRRKAEKAKVEKKQPLSYPSWDAWRAEQEAGKPAVLVMIRDDAGTVVRTLKAPNRAGLHRISWDLRWSAPNPTNLKFKPTTNPFAEDPMGPMAVPGTYSAQLYKQIDGALTQLGEPVDFEVRPLGVATLPAEDRAGLVAFQQKTARLLRAVQSANAALRDAESRLDHLKAAVHDTPQADRAWLTSLEDMQSRLRALKRTLFGDRAVAKVYEPISPSINGRLGGILFSHWRSSSAATASVQREYELAASQFAEVLPKLRTLIEKDLADIEAKMEAAGAPHTPGRLPNWKPE